MSLLLIVVVGAGTASRSVLALALARAFERQSWHVLTCVVEGDADSGVTRALAATRRVIGSAPAGSQPILVVLGDEAHQRRFVWALASAGLRTGVRLAVHIRAAKTPLHPSQSDFLQLADVIVTDSAFGASVVHHGCADAGSVLQCPLVVIPQFIDAEASPANGFNQRDAARREIFGLAANHLLIGCGAGTPHDPRQFLAMSIFRTFVDGSYWTCARCRGITLFDTNDDLQSVPTSTCSRCRASDGKPGLRWPTARLFVANQPTRPAGRPESGLGDWTVNGIRSVQGLEGRVVIEGDHDLPRAESNATVMRRLSCLDIHLLPHHLSDVEPVLLASCAMGVPAITTRFGAAPEVLGRAAQLVAPCVTLDDSAGHRTAIIDTCAAVGELLRLAGDASARAVLGDASRAAMHTHDETVVAGHWVDHLARLPAR